MIIDKDAEEKKAERKYREREKRKRKRMHISGKGVFELQRLMKSSIGRRVRKLKEKK